MPSIKIHLAAFVLAGSLAAPTLGTGAANCLTYDTAAQIVASWAALLSQNSHAINAGDVLTDDYTEYSSSFLALNGHCIQGNSVNSSKPWTDPVFNSLAEYNAAISSSRSLMTWTQSSISHDCSTIGIRGDMQVVGDGELFNAIALFGTQMSSAGEWKISKLFWEFDVVMAQKAIVDSGQCRRPPVESVEVGHIVR